MEPTICAFGVLAGLMLLDAGLEHSRLNRIFKQSKMPKNVIFDMLYLVSLISEW